MVTPAPHVYERGWKICTTWTLRRHFKCDGNMPSKKDFFTPVKTTDPCILLYESLFLSPPRVDLCCFYLSYSQGSTNSSMSTPGKPLGTRPEITPDVTAPQSVRVTSTFQLSFEFLCNGSTTFILTHNKIREPIKWQWLIRMT